MLEKEYDEEDRKVSSSGVKKRKKEPKVQVSAGGKNAQRKMMKQAMCLQSQGIEFMYK